MINSSHLELHAEFLNRRDTNINWNETVTCSNINSAIDFSRCGMHVSVCVFVSLCVSQIRLHRTADSWKLSSYCFICVTKRFEMKLTHLSGGMCAACKVKNKNKNKNRKLKSRKYQKSETVSFRSHHKSIVTS